MKRKVNKTSEGDRMVYMGIICALAVVVAHGSDTIYDEIVATVDQDVLLYEARRSGNMRWSGLDKFMRRQRVK